MSRNGAFGSSVLALLSLAVALAAGLWIVTQADLLGVRFDRAYYVLLVVLGLAASAFLFGVLRSSATLTGKHLGVGFEVGGAAALFLLVVWGGAHLTAPPESFSPLIRLRYTGPPVDRAAFDEVLPHTQLIVRFGSNTRTPEVNRLGEAILGDVPGRFRDGTINVELVSDRIELVHYDPSKSIRMPSVDAPVELNAALREPEEKRAAREKARADLETAIAVAQRGLIAQSGMLFPAIDEFLAFPSEEGWRRVLNAAERVRIEIDRGFDAALNYDGRYGGLLAEPQQVRLAQSDASRALSAPAIGGAFTSVLPAWQTRALNLHQIPNPESLDDVRAWRKRLELAHQAVRNALEPIAARLRVQT